MTFFKYKFRVLLATVFGTVTLAAVPVYAMQSGPNAAASNTTSTSTTHKVELSEAESPTGTTSGTGSVQDRAERLLNTKREQGKAHSVAVRQKVCANHKTEIDQKLTNLGTRAQKQLNIFNSIFTKVQAFKANHNVDAPNYDALVATANVKQAAATTAVNALKALSGTTIDCTSTDPASTLADVKTAADDAKTALQDYRSSIKDVVKALQSVNSSANKSGSN